MSAFRPKQQAVIVRSKKKIKLARRLQNERGIQRAAYVREAQDRSEEVRERIREGARAEWVNSRHAVLSNEGWRCTVYQKTEQGWANPYVCDHKHKKAGTAIACAEQEVRRRNKPGWTDEKVLDLVREVTAKG